MDPQLTEFILQTVVPLLGLVTGTFMTFAPYRAVLKASRDGTLGDLNATPWIFMLGNCCGWLAYSFLLQNVYVFLGNAPGFILAIWLNIQAIKLQYENHRSSELQTAIIAGLKDMKSTKNKGGLVKKNDVAVVVEQAMDNTPPISLLDPSTTAPALDDDDNSGFEGTVSTDNSGTDYNTVAGSAADAVDQAEQGIFQLGLARNDSIVPTAVQEAADHIMDYASFVWEISAQQSPAPASHELMVVAISIFWLLLISFTAFTQKILEVSTRILLIGVCVNVNLIFFYGAPLSKIATVLETKTSKLIHIPTMIFSLMNGTLWFVYGLAVGDVFIALPNGFGAVLGVIQVILCCLFPRHVRHFDETVDGLMKTTVKGPGGGGDSISSGSISLPQESTPLI